MGVGAGGNIGEAVGVLGSGKIRNSGGMRAGEQRERGEYGAFSNSCNP
jgi:hypothetical protein